jgi:hypothetical protein
MRPTTFKEALDRAIQGNGCIDAISEFLDEFYPEGFELVKLRCRRVSGKGLCRSARGIWVPVLLGVREPNPFGSGKLGTQFVV